MADFTSRFNELLTRTPDNGTALADALGVSKQTISAWKNGSRFPKRPTIRIIADYFNVGIPWLQGVTDDESAGMDLNTSASANDIQAIDDPDVRELICIYNELNMIGRQALMGTARGLASNPDMKKGGASSSATA